MRSTQAGFSILGVLAAAMAALIIGAAYGFAGIEDKAGQSRAAAADNALLAANKAEPLAGGAQAPAGHWPNGAADGAAKAAPAAKNGGSSGAEAKTRGILNGYKGYRYHRPGYKSAGDGWWYPRAAFAGKSPAMPFMRPPGKMAAAQAGKAGRGDSRRHGASVLTTAHKSWCAEHYPSYRVSDNSYGITAGRRRLCLSPYME